MKSKNKLFLVVFSLSVLFISCEKYLDIKTSSILKFIETAEDCQRLLDNMSTMNANYPTDGQASSDDFYLLPTAFPGAYSQEEKPIYTWDISATRASAEPQWRWPYLVCYNANLVLEAIDRIKESTSTETYNNLRGSSLFYRAYAHWNVAQLYAKPYGATAESDLGIPIKLKSDINEKTGRGTVRDTYEQIIGDLKEAVDLLPTTSVVATRPSKASANAMLARVYLSMEDYQNAMAYSSAAIAIKGDLLDYNSAAVDKSATTLTPFIRFNPEVLFHSTMAGAQAGLPSLISPGDAGNPRAIINQALYNSYNSNDIRKIVFFKANTGANAGTYRFAGNYEQSYNASSMNYFNGLTTAELYLTRAECKARLSQKDSAMDDLNLLLKNRWYSGTFINLTASSADIALDIILKERRKELVMRGQRWTDLRRLNKDPRFSVDQSRTLTENSITTTYNLPPNSSRYTLLIPLDVIQNGNYMQNPR